jgi:hypothetical protein
MTRARALALLLLASCATAPEPKRSQTAPAPKPAARTEPAPNPSVQAVPGPKPAAQPTPAVQRRGGTLDVKSAQYETTLSAHCRKVPLPPNCVPPPSGEEVVFGMPKAPPPQPAPPPSGPPWYRWLWPAAGAAVKDADPEEASRRSDKPPKPNTATVFDYDWQPSEPHAPRYLPCTFAGGGGAGPSRPEKAPPDWIRCAYRCGRYQVELFDIRPSLDRDGKPESATATCAKFLKRAEDYARNKDDALRRQGK